jgi:hypothetical protein
MANYLLMGIIGVKENNFDLIKLRITLSLVSIFLLGLHLHSQEQNTPLVHKIIINNSLSSKIISTNNTEKIFTLSKDIAPYTMSIWIDS